MAQDPGTHFWHAHTGLQRGEGMFGSLVVRQSPSREPHIDLYDHDLPEHVIIVNEWQNKPLVEVYTSFHHGNGQQAADAVFINGKGQDRRSRPASCLQSRRVVYWLAHLLLQRLGSWRPTNVKRRQFSQSNHHSTIGAQQTEHHEALLSSANVHSRLTSSFTDDGNAS